MSESIPVFGRPTYLFQPVQFLLSLDRLQYLLHNEKHPLRTVSCRVLYL